MKPINNPIRLIERKPQDIEQPYRFYSLFTDSVYEFNSPSLNYNQQYQDWNAFIINEYLENEDTSNYQYISDLLLYISSNIDDKDITQGYTVWQSYTNQTTKDIYWCPFITYSYSRETNKLHPIDKNNTNYEEALNYYRGCSKEEKHQLALVNEYEIAIYGTIGSLPSIDLSSITYLEPYQKSLDEVFKTGFV
jgi:hypothetical protein